MQDDLPSPRAVLLSWTWKASRSPKGRCFSFFLGAILGCLLTSLILTIHTCTRGSLGRNDLERRVLDYQYFIEGRVFTRRQRPSYLEERQMATAASCQDEKEELEKLLHISALDPNIMTSKEFNAPSVVGQTRFLAEEYSVRGKILIAVLSRGLQPSNKAKMIHYTWGMGAIKRNISLHFFIPGEEDLSDFKFFPYTRLSESASLSKIAAVFETLQIVHKRYNDDFDWIYFVHDDVYLRPDLLLWLLRPLDPKGLVYMGHAGKGRVEDQKRLGLLPHEAYCMGGPGFVLSFTALKQLSPYMNVCLQAIEEHNRQHQEHLWMSEDVEFGRCISRTLGVQCSLSKEPFQAFMTDWDRKATNPAKLWEDSRFQKAVVVYPVHTFASMRTLHHYFMDAKVKLLQQKGLELFHQPLVDACGLTPSHILPRGMNNTDEFCVSQARSCNPLEFHFYKQPYPDMIPYKPQDRHDLPEWMFFDEDKIYVNNNDHPVVGKTGEFNEKLKNLIRDIKLVLQKRKKVPVGAVKILSGFFRENSHRGKEILVDIEVNNYHFNEAELQQTTLSRRVELVQPVPRSLYFNIEAVYVSDVLNIVVPLVSDADISQRVSNFLEQYKAAILEKTQDARLLLVTYGAAALKAANGQVERYLEHYPDAKMIIVPVQGEYSHTDAIKQAVAEIPSKELMYISDVDTTFRSDFIMRCRKTAVHMFRVYLPVPFQLYNASYTYQVKQRPSVLFVSRETGFWDSENFGHMCLYRSDFLAAEKAAKVAEGSLPPNSPDYLVAGVMKQGLQVLRAPDPGLTRAHWPKICPSSLDRTSREQCMHWHEDNLADRRDLAIYMLQLSKKLGRDAE